MRILRHEAGHAIDNAFRLHASRTWSDTFGSYRVPYPEWYQPQPGSRDYVLNLDAWYAQAHPAEDFAETFAVWLKPGSRWRRQYEGWGALRKLEYVDRIMREIGSMPPKVRPSSRDAPIEEMAYTVADYYKIRMSDMHSKKRSRAVARPRQVAMALTKELTQLSLPEIGSNFGGRDHTTVLHACRQVAKLRETHADMNHDVNFLLQVLRS